MIGIFADLHLTNWREFSKPVVDPVSGLPINSRLYQQLETLRQAFKSAYRRGVTTIVIAGDIFHERDWVPTDVLQFTYALFEWATTELGLKFVFVSGNHDQADKEGQIHALYSFQHLVQVVDQSLSAEIDGVSMNFVPFCSNAEDLKHILARGDEADLLIAHCGVDGGQVGPLEYRMKEPVTVDDLLPNQFKWVFLGHYHAPQTLQDNVLYVGSPYHLVRGEGNKAKRWLLYDPETEEVTSVKTGGAYFKAITGTEFLQAETLPQTWFYDVHVEDEEQLEDVRKKAQDYHVKIIPPSKATVSKSRIHMSEHMTDAQLLKAYIKHKKSSAEPETGLKLLAKVQNTAPSYTRMRFLSVEVDNFLTIGHAELRLHRPGSVVAVLGDNQTAEGYDSNGAGKSSLLPESIGWCLWGETIRKLPADSVVNNKRKRNCQVTVRVRLDKDLLQVTRFRKHKEHGGNGLILKLNDEDITPGTPTLAEEKLKGLLGMDFTTFLSVVAFSPDALRFVSSTDASQKQVLDSILQTRRFSAALEYAKASAKAVLVDRQKVQTALTVARESLSTQEGLLAQYNELNDNFQRREQDRLTGLQVQVDSRWKQVAGLEAQLDVEEASKTATEKQLAEIEIPDTTALQKEYTLLAKDLGLCQGRLTIVRGQRDDIQSELDKAINQAGKPCPTCGQRVANTGRMIIAYQASRNKFRQQVEQYEQQEVTIKEQRKAVGQKLLRAQELQETREELLSKLGGINQRISNYRNSVATHKDHINNLKAQMASAPVNDYKRLIKEAQIQVTKLTHDLADLEQADFAYEHDIAEAEFWVEAFGNSGIRSYLLDQILPELTEYANEYSRKLMGGNIIIEFNTHSGTRDKFQITAMNMDGSDLYVGNSNGEKRRIDVCVMLALFRVALSRTHINVLLLDEVLDSAIDRSGLESMVLLINTLARELKLTVFVTSHTDLNSRIQDCITLRKRDGLTSLVE